MRRQKEQVKRVCEASSEYPYCPLLEQAMTRWELTPMVLGLDCVFGQKFIVRAAFFGDS